MSSSVEEIRTKIEPTIKDSIDPIAKAKQEIVDKISEAVMGTVTPLVEQHVTPHIGKLVEIISAPFVGGYDESHGIFHEAVKKFTDSVDLKNLSKGFGEFDSTGRNYWTMRAATSKLDVMYEPLWALRDIFSEISPWGLIWRGQDQMRKKMDNAIYTFEERLKKKVEENAEAGKEVIEDVKNSVMEDFKFDSILHKIAYFLEIIKDIVMPPLNKVLHPAVKAILEPLESAIPDAVKQFIDINDEFEHIVNNIVDGCIKKVIE